MTQLDPEEIRRIDQKAITSIRADLARLGRNYSLPDPEAAGERLAARSAVRRDNAYLQRLEAAKRERGG
jgi:hypothetical protein